MKNIFNTCISKQILFSFPDYTRAKKRSILLFPLLNDLLWKIRKKSYNVMLWL